jgi:hypothetical protein
MGHDNPGCPGSFTIKRTDKDEWHEMGETSRDGKSWHQFFEMVLHRK